MDFYQNKLNVSVFYLSVVNEVVSWRVCVCVFEIHSECDCSKFSFGRCANSHKHVTFHSTLITLYLARGKRCVVVIIFVVVVVAVLVSCWCSFCRNSFWLVLFVPAILLHIMSHWLMPLPYGGCLAYSL